ncbi:MAG: 6-deoxyerythronolide-B synthase, partial [Nitrospinota bacterium]
MVILTPPDEKETLSYLVQTFHQHNRTVLLETTCVEQALWGKEAGVDGVIAKGHEAGGRVGEETTFILLQRLLNQVSLPVWAQGGIGLHTAGACYAAGAAGIVLDTQLLLTRESPLSAEAKESIARMDGSETICLGAELGETYRVYTRPGLPAVEELRQKAQALMQHPDAQADTLNLWRREVQSRVGWEREQAWLLGQDAAFAASLARRFRTVGGVLEGIREAIETHVRIAQALRPLDEGSPLARAHGTRYPVVQGPMTRVSDRAAFAAKVAEGGGLPFLALALLRAPEIEPLLAETRQLLGDRPWGVGILGFVPQELRQEQLEVIRNYRPPFALIAGGRPDQAALLEQEGIPTYLHVPSPGLLRMFLENGARRFVFEGRECGGHVGPRSSFVLWNTMIDELLEALPPDKLSQCHILFAGGIHDALSSAMVATMAAPLAERGVKIGVLLGTAYLFTQEAIETGAITRRFQEEAIRCSQTVLLETGPGHATRCAITPYVSLFQQEKARLLQRNLPAEEIRTVLEDLNLGRLRIASKGITRHQRYGQDPQAPKFVTVSEEEQYKQGMYMIGQVAALRDRPCTIPQLHHDVSVKGSERLAALPLPAKRSVWVSSQGRSSDIAIVGMSCLLPKAPDLQTYWENILHKVDAITEVPQDRWDWQRYFDPDRKARDKVYSKWGGFIDPIPFDPTRYGIPPNTLRSIDPLQLLTLELVHKALEDAGYLDRPFPREHTSVILGVGGGSGDLGQQYTLRSGLPMLFDDLPAEVWTRLPEWTEDSFAGILLNVAAGRVANRFDFGGVNYTVDAACASSLAAVYLAVRELEDGTSDMVIVGGADTVQSPFAYFCFSKTQALSPRGRCRPFDAEADGIVISEGIAILVLKRLADAERDGDRIYAVIKAVAGSSDGRDKGLTAPRPEGQIRALRRAYAKAGFSPATVGLIEAHGTGTVAGDRAEVE